MPNNLDNFHCIQRPYINGNDVLKRNRWRMYPATKIIIPAFGDCNIERQSYFEKIRIWKDNRQLK